MVPHSVNLDYFGNNVSIYVYNMLIRWGQVHPAFPPANPRCPQTRAKSPRIVSPPRCAKLAR